MPYTKDKRDWFEAEQAAKVVETPNLPRVDNDYEEHEDEEIFRDSRGIGFISPLGIYLKQNKVSLGCFARAIGMPHKTVAQYARGVVVPVLAAAFEIERLTKGAVPMETWLALSLCRSQLHRWRERQPESSASDKSELDAAGFSIGAFSKKKAKPVKEEDGAPEG